MVLILLEITGLKVSIGVKASAKGKRAKRDFFALALKLTL